MIELTPLDKDEWMPRVRVQVIETADEARRVLDELVTAGIRSDIQSMDLIAQKPPGADWPEGYVVRLALGPSTILGWAHARRSQRRTAVLSWETARASWDHGYMREAIPRIVQWLLRRRGIIEIYAAVPIGDDKSEAVAKRGGFEPTEQGDPAKRTHLWLCKGAPETA